MSKDDNEGGLKKVLIVDDSEVDRSIIKKLLKKEPYSILEARSAVDALEMIAVIHVNLSAEKSMGGRLARAIFCSIRSRYMSRP